MGGMSALRMPSFKFRRRGPRGSSAGEPGSLSSVSVKRPPLIGGVVEAVWAALVSSVLFVLFVLVGWLAGSTGSGSGLGAVVFGLQTWLFAQGVPLLIQEQTVSVVPWMAAVVPLGSLVWAGGRLLGRMPDAGGSASSVELTGSGARRDVVRGGVGFVSGYAVVMVLVAVLARVEGISASVLWASFAGVCWPVIAFVVAVQRRFEGGLGRVIPRLGWFWRVDVPDWGKRVVGPAVRGVVVLLAAGVVAVVAAVVVGWQRVEVVNSYVSPGLVGGVLFTVVQLAYALTLATWAVGFAAGPGFSIGEDTLITWGNASVEPVPLVPVLGALPDPGPLPGWMTASVAVPVVVGMCVAVWALRSVGSALPAVGVREAGRAGLAPRSGRGLLLGRLLVVSGAVLLCAVMMGAVGVLTAGSLGNQRLVDVGVSGVAMGATLAAEMLTGAWVVVFASMVLRARFVSPEESAKEPATSGRR